MTTNENDSPAIATPDLQTRFRIIALFIKKLAELLPKGIEDDLARFDSLDSFQQMSLWAHWEAWLKRSMPIPAVDFTISPLEQMNALNPVFTQLYGPDFFDGMGEPPPSSKLKEDVAKRMEWLKQCAAKEFESTVFSIVDRHSILSPIEQIFLMEWCFAKVDQRYGLSLKPQEPIRTASGKYTLDYLVTSADANSSPFAIAIELDGHEFHEKNKEQVIKDKRRERAILQAGIRDRLTVLRFSGAEVVRNCKKCIGEVVQFIEEMRLQLRAKSQD